MSRGPYAIVAGTIAAGKSTAVTEARRHLAGADFYEEDRDIFLVRSAADPAAFGFLNQLAYTLQFLEQAATIAGSAAPYVIQHRSIHETHGVFTLMRHEEGLIDDDQYELLSRVDRAARALVTPDLLIHLRVDPDVALERARRRKLAGEESLTLGAMERLDAAYRRWFDEFAVCPKVEIDTGATPVAAVGEAIATAVRQ